MCSCKDNWNHVHMEAHSPILSSQWQVQFFHFILLKVCVLWIRIHSDLNLLALSNLDPALEFFRLGPTFSPRTSLSESGQTRLWLKHILKRNTSKDFKTHLYCCIPLVYVFLLSLVLESVPDLHNTGERFYTSAFIWEWIIRKFKKLLLANPTRAARKNM